MSKPYEPSADEVSRVLALVGLRPSDATDAQRQVAARLLTRAGGHTSWAAYLMREELRLPQKR